MSEETEDAARTAPRAVIRSLVAAGAIGFLILVLSVMAIPDITAGQLTTEGLPYVVTTVLGNTVGHIMIVAVTIAVFVCSLAIQAWTARTVLAMGRENDLPGGQWLGRTNHHGVPVNATLAVTGIGLLILIVNLNNPKAFNVVVALGIVLIYLAYLGATLVGLKKRLGGWPEEPASSGLFTLRKPWGMVVNIVAVIYGGVMLVNLAWPRAEFYGTEWYQQYAVVIFVPVLIVAGLCYRAATRNRADAIDADIDPEPEALTA